MKLAGTATKNGRPKTGIMVSILLRGKYFK